MNATNGKVVYAHEVDYWKTGDRRSCAQWMERTLKQLRDHGGKNIIQAVGDLNGREAFMFQFELRGQTYKIIWPVLPLASHLRSERNAEAARVQAATTLYHDIKARCVVAARYGDEVGFFQFRMLPDGRILQQLTSQELTRDLPALIAGPTSPPT